MYLLQCSIYAVYPVYSLLLRSNTQANTPIPMSYEDQLLLLTLVASNHTKLIPILNLRKLTLYYTNFEWKITHLTHDTIAFCLFIVPCQQLILSHFSLVI